MHTNVSEETLSFLHDVFAPCTTGYLTLTAIHPDGNRSVPSRHVPLGSEAALHDALNHLMQANNLGWGGYFGAATRQSRLGRWSRGGRRDLAALPAMFVDLDGDPDFAWARLAFFDLPSSIIVHSGKGYHAYFLLDTPTTDLDTADRVLRGLAKRLEGDPAVTVTHSMRLVGTRNTKPGRDNAPCTIVHYHPERRYALEEFLPFAERPPTPAIHYPRQYHVPDRTNFDRQWLTEAVTDAVLRQLDGRWKGNGFIAARCPYCHARDRVGMHFSYNSESGVGRCFGKHGRLSLGELAKALGILYIGNKVLT